VGEIAGLIKQRQMGKRSTGSNVIRPRDLEQY